MRKISRVSSDIMLNRCAILFLFPVFSVALSASLISDDVDIVDLEDEISSTEQLSAASGML